MLRRVHDTVARAGDRHPARLRHQPGEIVRALVDRRRRTRPGRTENADFFHLAVRLENALGVAQFGHGTLEKGDVARVRVLLRKPVERGDHLGEVILEAGRFQNARRDAGSITTAAIDHRRFVASQLAHSLLQFRKEDVFGAGDVPLFPFARSANIDNLER